MAQIRSAAEIADKWRRVTPGRTEDYRLGVQNPRVDWENATAAAEGTWRDGVTAAAARGAFAKGVREAGTIKWQTNTLLKGPGRFAEGVQIGVEAYERGFAPYRDVIERTVLPPRRPKGDPGNIERVRAISQALRAKKIGSARAA
jgi:hypothetical protein